MPEGLLTGGAVAGAVHDDPDHAPEPSADAPRGWTWDRKGAHWKPRQRGPILFSADPNQAGRVVRAGTGAEDTGDTGPAAGSAPGSDPDPSWLREDSEPDSGTDSGKISFDDVPDEVKADAASLAGMIGLPVLAFLRSVDPYCGTVLAESYEPIIDAVLPLVLRSKKVVSFFTAKDSDWLMWLGLGQALWPVATAIGRHHVFRTVEVVRDEVGRPHVVQRQPAEPGHGDHLQPPVQPYNYAA